MQDDEVRSDDELPEKIQEWLTATGFPLEMRVARAFRERNPLVLSQGSQYVDPMTGAVRETDIEALWMQFTERFAALGLHIVVECKSGGQPWILFADPATQEYIDLIFYGLAVAASSEPDDPSLVGALHDQLAKLGAPLFEGPNPACFGITQMKGRGRGQGANEKDEAYDAVRQAASGAAAAVRDLKPDVEPPGFNYAVPVVVTTHPLFIARLDEAGLPTVERTLSGSLHIRPAGSADSLLVHVVHEDGLDDFIDVCHITARAFETAELDDSYVRRPVRRLKRLARRLRLVPR